MYHSASPDAETSPTQASSPKLQCCTKIWIQTLLPRPPFTLGVVFCFIIPICCLRLSFCEKCREFAAVLKWGIGAPVWTGSKAGNGRSRDQTLLELQGWLLTYGGLTLHWHYLPWLASQVVWNNIKCFAFFSEYKQVFSNTFIIQVSFTSAPDYLQGILPKLLCQQMRKDEKLSPLTLENSVMHSSILII